MQDDERVLVQGCLIADGETVFLRANDTWTRELNEAALWPWEEAERELRERELDDCPLVFGLSLVEADVQGDTVVPYGFDCAPEERAYRP